MVYFASSQRHVVVIEVAEMREYNPAYHAYSSALGDRVVASVRSQGWETTRIAAASRGVAGTRRAVAEADAVVIMGGEDLAPGFYGGAERYTGGGRHFPVADEAQLAAVQQAAQQGTPLIGICRGHQVINVAFGGDLIQHLDSPVHRNETARIEDIMSRHGVRVDGGTRIAASLGGLTAPVQSAHHQAIETLGEGLRVAARSEQDDIIEAVEHRTLPIFGVQWHPEDFKAPAAQLDRLLGLLGEQKAHAAA